MEKKASNPFPRGMGAKEDFVTEPFLPSEQFKAKQREMMERLIASGIDPEEVAGMFSVPCARVSAEDDADG